MTPSPSIVYEDEYIIVINKPHGLITHKKNVNDDQETVVNWVIKNYSNLRNIGEPFIASGTQTERAGIVHRLDKDTSGLLLIAKNGEVFYYFKDLFQTKKIKKYYLALVHGKTKPKGLINSPLGRIGLKRTTKLSGKKLIDSKKAETEYVTIKNYANYSLVELSPKTGRTHQLRVHLNSIGHPITGDPVYGFKKLPGPAGLNRLFLHAYKLEFQGFDGKALTLEADLPENLQKILEDLSRIK